MLIALLLEALVKGLNRTFTTITGKQLSIFKPALRLDPTMPPSLVPASLQQRPLLRVARALYITFPQTR